MYGAYYAGISLSCAGIQWWKSVSFHCRAPINLVGKMSNEGGGHPPPTTPTLGYAELRVKWDELVHVMNKNIILQCRHTETPGVRLVFFLQESMYSISFKPVFYTIRLIGNNKLSRFPAVYYGTKKLNVSILEFWQSVYKDLRLKDVCFKKCPCK